MIKRWLSLYSAVKDFKIFSISYLYVSLRIAQLSSLRMMKIRKDAFSHGLVYMLSEVATFL